MTKFRYFKYQCDICEEKELKLFDVDTEEVSEQLECPTCQMPSMLRRMGAPQVMRAALHDGYKRGENWQLYKEAKKIEKESLNLPHEKRVEHKKAARKLLSASTKKSAKTTDS